MKSVKVACYVINDIYVVSQYKIKNIAMKIIVLSKVLSERKWKVEQKQLSNKIRSWSKNF